jgi:hypothetical protein
MTPAQLRWLEALTTLALDNGYNRAELQLELRKARAEAQKKEPASPSWRVMIEITPQITQGELAKKVYAHVYHVDAANYWSALEIAKTYRDKLLSEHDVRDAGIIGLCRA